MKKGSWKLRFQRSDIKKSNLWLTACHKRVKCSCGIYRACGVMFWNVRRKKRLLLISSSLCYFQNGGNHVRHSGHRMSKELFTGRWMGTGDTRWSHPVTICTGVMLVIQIGHRCWGITWASLQIFGRVTKCLVPQFMACQVDSDVTAFFYRFICVFRQVAAFFSRSEISVFVFFLFFFINFCPL